MAKVIDYWRGLIADVKEAESNSPADLRAVGDLWYPVLRMRVLAAVHDGAERKLGPCDLPADHADAVAHRVWDDLVAAVHKRAVPEAWADYAAVIAVAKPIAANCLGVSVAELPEVLVCRTNAQLDDLVDVVFAKAYPEALPSREEHAVKGAITAFLFAGREWPDLGTWMPFTLYSITARYFEQGRYLGPKQCSSESEILDLVNAAPFNREWALSVVRRRAQSRTVESYLAVLEAILDQEELPAEPSLVSRRLTLVEWLSDPEARLARFVEAQGLNASLGVVRRAFGAAEWPSLRAVLLASVGEEPYPAEMTEDERRLALERLVEAMEALALRTELIVQVTERNGKRGAAWAEAVIAARAPKALKANELALLGAIARRKDSRALLGPVQRNRTLRSMHRTLQTAARPDAGLVLRDA